MGCPNSLPSCLCILYLYLSVADSEAVAVGLKQSLPEEEWLQYIQEKVPPAIRSDGNLVKPLLGKYLQIAKNFIGKIFAETKPVC